MQRCGPLLRLSRGLLDTTMSRTMAAEPIKIFVWVVDSDRPKELCVRPAP